MIIWKGASMALCGAALVFCLGACTGASPAVANPPAVAVGAERLDEIRLNTPDLSRIPDGSYMGEYRHDRNYAMTYVTVRAHRIEAVDLIVHENGRGRPAEVLVDRVVDFQSVELDAVAGATSSSLAILKAVEDALNKALASAAS